MDTLRSRRGKEEMLSRLVKDSFIKIACMVIVICTRKILSNEKY